jgi:hypothetical protein
MRRTNTPGVRTPGEKATELRWQPHPHEGRRACGTVNIRRLQLDVDKAVHRPDLLELAEAIDGVPGVEAVNITVTDIDIETVGTEVTIEGDNIDIRALTAAIEKAGAALHSIDEIVVGDRIIERVPRAR